MMNLSGKNQGPARKLLAFFLSVAMVMTSVPTSALSEAATEASTAAQAQTTQAATATSASSASTAAATDQTSSQATAAEDTSAQQGSAAKGSGTTTTDSARATTSDEAATAEDGVVSVSLDFENAYITYLGQVVADPTDHMSVPEGKALSFAASANEGYDLTDVKTSVNGTETTLSPNADGTYTIDAASVASGLKVVVEATAQADAATVDDAEPLASTTVDEPSSSASGSAATTTTDATTEDAPAASVMSLSTASAADYTLEVGQTQYIKGAYSYSNDTWKSSDSSIASVAKDNGWNSSNATVTANKVGTVTITHTYGWGNTTSTGTWTVTVTAATLTVTFDANGGSADAPASQSG
ncbi:MAG: hypothetical protein PHI26_06560 [Atopobiaceae bacterium]|nr:hypothetical protein [Atopobiaceae bacterium]